MFKIPSKYRDQFWEWCQKHHIVCAFMGTNSTTDNFSRIETDTWYIGSEHDRTFAVLRWS